MTLKIDMIDDMFEVSQPLYPEMPYIGRGSTMMEAIGRYFHNNQQSLGLKIEVSGEAWPAELARREQEMAKR